MPLRLKIRERIVIAYVGLFVLLVLLAGVGLSITSETSRVLPGADAGSDRAITMTIRLMLQLPKLLNHAYRGDLNSDGDRHKLGAMLAEIDRRVHVLAEQSGKLPGEAGTRLAALWLEFRQAVLHVFESPTPSERDAFQVTIVIPMSFTFRELLSEIAETNLILLGDQTFQFQNRIARGRVLLLSLTVLGLVLCVGFLAALGGLFVKPTRQIIEAIDALELDAARPGFSLLRTRPDEIGDLAQAVERLIGRVRSNRKDDLDLIRRLERRSEHAMDCIPDALLICDLEGGILYTNAAARQLIPTGAELAYIDALPWPAIAGLFARCVETAQPQVGHDIERAVQVFVKGEEKFYLPGAFPIAGEGGMLEEVALLLTDVSYIRQLDEMKVDLVATVSHQLKTPLTSVLMSLHMLRGLDSADKSPTELELVNTALTESERLRSTIQSLLDMARIQSGSMQMQLSPVRTSEWLGELAATYGPRMTRLGLEMETQFEPDLPVLHIDQARLEAAIDNLMSNAMKYCRRGDRVTFSATLDQGDSPAVVVAVRDTGPGIAPAHMIRIFEKFYRAPNSTQPGAGLGLAIARRIVRAHGGELTCNSTLGEGSSFAIVLFLQTTGGVDPPDRPADAPEESGGTTQGGASG